MNKCPKGPSELAATTPAISTLVDTNPTAHTLINCMFMSAIPTKLIPVNPVHTVLTSTVPTNLVIIDPVHVDPISVTTAYSNLITATMILICYVYVHTKIKE
jgi:hypothetical protein